MVDDNFNKMYYHSNTTSQFCAPRNVNVVHSLFLRKSQVYENGSNLHYSVIPFFIISDAHPVDPEFY